MSAIQYLQSGNVDGLDLLADVPAGYAVMPALVDEAGAVVLPFDVSYPPGEETGAPADDSPASFASLTGTPGDNSALATALSNLSNDTLTQKQRIDTLLAALALLQVDPVTKTYVDQLVQAIMGIDAQQATAIQQLQALLAQDDGLLQNLLATVAQHTQQLTTQGGWIGTLGNLLSTAKTSLVAAYNELFGTVAGHSQTLDKLTPLIPQVVRWDLETTVTVSANGGVPLGYTSGRAYAVAVTGGTVPTLQLSQDINQTFARNGDIIGLRVLPGATNSLTLDPYPLEGFGSAALKKLVLAAGNQQQYWLRAFFPNLGTTRGAYWVVGTSPTPAQLSTLDTLAARAANLYLRFADGSSAGYADLDTALNESGTHGGAINAQPNSGALTVTQDNRGIWPAFFDAQGATITVTDGVTLTSQGKGIQGLNFANFYLTGGATSVFDLTGVLPQDTEPGKASLLVNGQCYITLRNAANVLVLNGGYYKKLTGPGKFYLYGTVQVGDLSGAPNVVDRRSSASGGAASTGTGIDYANPVTLTQAATLQANKAYYVTGAAYALTLPDASQNLGSGIFIEIASNASGFFPLANGSTLALRGAETMLLRATLGGWKRAGGDLIAMEARLETTLSQQDAFYDGMVLPVSVAQASNTPGLANTSDHCFVVQRDCKAALLLTVTLASMIGNYFLFFLEATLPDGSMLILNEVPPIPATNQQSGATNGFVNVPVASQSFKAGTKIRPRLYQGQGCSATIYGGYPGNQVIYTFTETV